MTLKSTMPVGRLENCAPDNCQFMAELAARAMLQGMKYDHYNHCMYYGGIPVSMENSVYDPITGDRITLRHAMYTKYKRWADDVLCYEAREDT